jgi:Gpi18-like mannosyltransferase
LGGYQAALSPILGSGFDSWLANASSNSVVGNPNIFKYLLILKFPYLVLDIAIAFLLKRFFDDQEKAKKAFTLWLFNPFTIFLIYAFSNVDIFAVLLTVVAFLLLKKEKLILASIILGIAAGFKLYPLLFIPFLFINGKDLREKIFIVLIPAIILGIVTIPFWSQDFVQSALISGLTTRIFNPGFSIGFGESMIVGLFSISILFFYALLVDKKLKLFNYWVVLLIFIFAFSHFHIAWLLWIAPFIVILAIKKPALSLSLFFLAVLSFAIPMLYDDRSMTISLFRIYSTWYDLISTPFAIVQKFYDPYNLQSVLHSVLAGGSLVIGYKLLNKEEEK